MPNRGTGWAGRGKQLKQRYDAFARGDLEPALDLGADDFECTGVFIGTVDYVAAEQLRGERTDARADVYSLAALLFHALTGEVPFPRDDDMAKMYAHGQANRPVRVPHRDTDGRSVDRARSKPDGPQPARGVATTGAVALVVREAEAAAPATWLRRLALIERTSSQPRN